MANPRAFISFDFDNNETERTLFVGQCRNSRIPFTIQDWSSKSALPQSQWEGIVRDKINRTNMVIVLVSTKTGTATGVAKEIQMAREQNVPYFGVYVGGANSNTPLPPGLARNRVIAWDWAAIASAIDQMMTEAKNRS